MHRIFKLKKEIENGKRVQIKYNKYASDFQIEKRIENEKQKNFQSLIEYHVTNIVNSFLIKTQTD